MSKLKFIILNIIIIFFSCSSELSSQLGFTAAKGPESISKGAYTANSLGISSMLNNQAGLTDLSNFGVILSIEQRFQLSELNIASAGLAYNADKLGVFGFVLSNFSFDTFTEQKFGFAYARKLVDNFSVGLQLDYLSTRIDGFGSQSAVTFEVGLQSQISESVQLGAHIFSPVQAELTDGDEIPAKYNFGVLYTINDQIKTVIEVEKIIEEDISIIAGVQYELIDRLYLNIGTSTNPTRLSFGIMYGINNSTTFGLAASNHEILGLSPSTGIQYEK